LCGEALSSGCGRFWCAYITCSSQRLQQVSGMPLFRNTSNVIPVCKLDRTSLFVLSLTFSVSFANTLLNSYRITSIIVRWSLTGLLLYRIDS
jgi:hypothetical protein